MFNFDKIRVKKNQDDTFDFENELINLKSKIGVPCS